MRPIDADKLCMYLADYQLAARDIDNEAADFIDDVLEIIDEQPTIEQPTWISCAERLPDEHVDVQMYWKSTGTQATGFYTDESWYTYAEDGYYTDCKKAPTHWKAVGEPPKEDE